MPSLFPGVDGVVSRVRELLLPDQPCRAFVSGDPTPQAYCMGGSKDHTVIIGLTSGLIQLMSDAELAFVVGHEIGHHLMGHHRRMRPSDDAVQSINFRSLQRMGEIIARAVRRWGNATNRRLRALELQDLRPFCRKKSNRVRVAPHDGMLSASETHSWRLLPLNSTGQSTRLD